MKSRAGLMRFLRRMLRISRWFLPPDFRRQYADEMGWAQWKRLEAAASRGLGSLLLAGTREGWDVVRTGVREWGDMLSGWALAKGTNGARRGWTTTVSTDVRMALRGMRRNPGFALLAVLTLAVGIGSNTAIFSVVDSVLFRSLPWEGADRLTVIWSGSRSSADVSRGWTSYPDYSDVAEEQRSFEAMGAYRTGPVTLLEGSGDPTSVTAVYATASLFDVAGIGPALGRTFLEDEDRIGGPKVAVISNGVWTQRFGGDEGAVGRSVTIDGDAHTIVGVMPAGYDFPIATGVWLPGVQNVGEDGRGMHRLRVVARLESGVALAAASDELNALALGLEQAYPDSNDDVSIWAESLQEALVHRSRTTLLILLGAVGLVLLIVCANVANLLLVRATARRREVGVRTALGASHSRLVAQFLTEGLVLAVAGGLLGVGLAYLTLDMILASAPVGALPRLSEVTLDTRVLAVMSLVVLATGLFFGLVPVLRIRDQSVAGRLRVGGRGQASGGGQRMRSSLVVVETAIAMVLIFGAGLLVRSFQAVQSVEPGFEPENLWIVPVVLPFSQYEGQRWPEVASIIDESLQETRQIPGVTAAAYTYAPPTRPSWTTGFTIQGRPEPQPSDRPEAYYRPVSPGYFEAVGVRFVAGRDFTANDGAEAPGVVIVNEAFATEYFPDGEALGSNIIKESWWEGTPEGEWRIVGVVEDVRFAGRERDTRPGFYFPHAQRPMTDMFLVLRTRRDVAEIMPLVRASIWRHDPAIPLENVRSASSELDSTVAGRRFSTTLMGLFGLVALGLAAAGLFGVLSYTVSRRTHEMGVRISLGAGRTDVRKLVIVQAMRLTLGGILLGVLAVSVLSRLVSSLLFETGRMDPLTLGVVSVLLLAVSFAASFLPARRATRVDPVRALRAE